MNNSQLTKTLIEALRSSEDSKTTGYDTAATVKRIENGVAWVHIPGGVDETPAKLTINASVGDVVQVRVSGGRAFLVGNGSAPPTDDTTALNATKTANKAHRTALQASEEATEAWNYAGTAAEAAVSAKTSADSAATAASNAWDHAEEARLSAISANNSANNALVQLSVVEDVAGTLRWISEHGSFVPTTDTRVIEGSVYFVYENGDYVPIASPDPSANPSQEGWYVLDVTESQAKYIMAHLAVTSAGLWVLPVDQLAEHPLVDSNGDQLVDSNDNPLVDFSADPQHASGYKVLLSGTGMSVFNNEGAVVANYGTTTTIGAEMGKHVYIDTDSVDIMDGQNYIATFGQETAIYSTDGTELAHFGYDLGESASGTAIAPYYTLGTRTVNSTVGNYSLVAGIDNTASGYSSVAMGTDSEATEHYSFAVGDGAKATGPNSVAFGRNTEAASILQMVIGVYNEIDSNSNYSFIIGTGVSEQNRESGFTVDRYGNVKSRSMDSGRYENVSVPANSYADFSITFNRSFTSAPIVTASFWSTSTAVEMGYLSLAVHTITTTGFQVRVFNKDSSARAPYINWIALLT